MRFQYLFAAAAIGLAPGAVQAQSYNAPPDTASTDAPEKNIFDGDYLVVGGGAIYGPSYEGSDDYIVNPIPAVQGRIGGVTITPRAGGAALDFIPDGKGAKFGLAFGPVATYSANRDRHIQDPVVRAAGRLKADIAVGASGGVTAYRLLSAYDSLSVSADVQWDIRGARGGMVISPAISYATPLSKATLVTLAVTAKHVNDDYADYYYSVSPVQSAASGLPIYRARGGWASVGGTMLVAHSLGGDLRKGGLSVFAVGGYTRLLNDARYNPYTAIRGSANQWIGGGGLALAF